MNGVPTLDALNKRDSAILHASKHMNQIDIDKFIENIKKNQMLDGQKKGPCILQEDDGEID